MLVKHNYECTLLKNILLLFSCDKIKYFCIFVCPFAFEISTLRIEIFVTTIFFSQRLTFSLIQYLIANIQILSCLGRWSLSLTGLQTPIKHQKYVLLIYKSIKQSFSAFFIKYMNAQTGLWWSTCQSKNYKTTGLYRCWSLSFLTSHVVEQWLQWRSADWRQQ